MASKDKEEPTVDVPSVESFALAKDAETGEAVKVVPVTVHTPHEPDPTNATANPQIPVMQEADEAVALPPQNPAETQDIRFIPAEPEEEEPAPKKSKSD